MIFTDFEPSQALQQSTKVDQALVNEQLTSEVDDLCTIGAINCFRIKFVS